MSKPIALQLYSLRAGVYPEGSDMPSLLKTVAEIGYKGVELAGMLGSTPEEIKKVADDLGIEVCSSHASLPTPENVQEIVDTQQAMGNKRVVSGFGADSFQTVDACKAAAEKYNTAAELLKPFGMTYGFHNHWWEFATVDGQLVYDIVMAEGGDFFSELDVYWCAYGKSDPAKTVSRYKTRLPLLHIKDGMLEEDYRGHTAVGSGKLDMPAIIGNADPNTLQWIIVELDNCKTDMLEAVKQSYTYLTGSSLALGNK